MAFPLQSTPYSTAAYDDECFTYTLSAGPETWPYGFDYNIQEVGTHLNSTVPEFLPLYEAGRDPPSPYPISARGLPAVSASLHSVSHHFEPSHTDSQSPASNQGLSLITDSHTLGVDDVPGLTTTATENGSIVAPSPHEFRSPEQVSITTEARPSPSGTRKTFPMQAVIPLREWFDQNINDPYPSKETKEALARQTGLAFKQVNHWFINARKRSLPRANDSGMIQSSLTTSPAVSAISSHETLRYDTSFNGPFGNLSPVTMTDPMSHFNSQPWLSRTQPLLTTTSNSGSITPDSTTPLHASSSAGPEYVVSSIPTSSYMSTAQAVPRRPTGPTRTLSSALSHNSRPDLVSNARHSRRGVRRSIRSQPPRSHANVPRRQSNSGSDRDQSDDQRERKNGEIFQCTFANCGKPFSSKTWKRHEETKHLPRFQWTCMATGFLVPAPPSPQTTPNPLANPFVPQTTSVAPRMMCAFCQKRDPDPNTHPQECPHRIADCASRPDPERTFSRKDHLFQHLRNFHRMTPPDGTFGAQWKSRVDHAGRSWPCGFCGERLGSWERRARHLRSHFREGCRVETDWDERRVRPSLSYSL